MLVVLVVVVVVTVLVAVVVVLLLSFSLAAGTPAFVGCFGPHEDLNRVLGNTVWSSTPKDNGHICKVFYYPK